MLTIAISPTLTQLVRFSSLSDGPAGPSARWRTPASLILEFRNLSMDNATLYQHHCQSYLILTTGCVLLDINNRVSLA